jgi:hypothetical protein
MKLRDERRGACAFLHELRASLDTPMLMGRKLNDVFSFRPINVGGARKGDERAEPLDFPESPARGSNSDGHPAPEAASGEASDLLPRITSLCR